jgi:hypothetical protein
MNEQLRQELLAMREENIRVRNEVNRDSSPFAGYNPRVEELENRNATRLKEIIAEHGWPGRSLAGEDGTIAAWFIAQQAIGDPPFRRKALELLREAHSQGEASAIGAAYLEDSICMFEGRPQIYGTQFQPDDYGIFQPYPIADPEHVNERRRALGMNTIEERTRELQAGGKPEYNPEKRAEFERGYNEWLKKVGWRE